MAPKHRRRPSFNDQPEEGTPMERAILCSLGEMIGMFKDWMVGQGQNQNAVQPPESNHEKELEQKQK